MYDRLIPHVDKNSKLIIGLGDSFTQGVGSWSKETYKEYGGFIDPLKVPHNLEIEMYAYSWVAQLCTNHLPDYTPINFGASGKGNRASVKELYLNPKTNIEKVKTATLVLMLSGIERFDFIKKEFKEHHHFFAMWPNYWDSNSTHKKLWKLYAKEIWSEKFVCLEALLNIREAEMFAKANGWNFVVGSAFDQRITREYFIDNLGIEHIELVNSIPWDKFIRPQGCKSFMQLLLRYDGREELADGAFLDYYSKLKEPTEYITNCMHPTREGYRIIAEEIYNFIK
tara:strand:+ start:38 stop:886 length:849 start_codon:yes stop_codon:yes gene_type:complete